MYVKITNNSDKVNRLYLEKLGISTKRDSDETIGQFGSGAKFAPIAAMRKGWEWISTGNDDFGAYEMKYGVRHVTGIDCIVFEYGDGTVKDSSYTLEAGSLSWEDDFQIIREALANAIDAHVEFGAEWSWSIVSEVTNSSGEFSVYITDMETGEPPSELIDILENIDNWFSIDRESIYSGIHGEIYSNISDDEEVKIFHRGVRVHEITVRDGLRYRFDYEFANAVLNEERRLRDAYRVNSYIVDVIGSLGEEEYGIVRLLLEEPNTAFEFTAMGLHDVKYRDWDSIWAEQWRKIHGQKAIPGPTFIDEFVISRLRSKGYKIVPVPDCVVHILEEAGVDTIKEILGEGYDIEVVELNVVQSLVFDEAVDACNNAGFNIDPKKFKFYYDDDTYAAAGKAVGDIRYINTLIITPNNLSDLIGTIIHEDDHCVTNLRDGDELFRSCADDHIGRLVMKINNKTMTGESE